MFGSTFAETTALAITRHVAEHGALPPTSRQIAKDSRMSSSSLSNLFDGRADMIRRSTVAWASHHSDRLVSRVARAGWDGFLPLDPEALLEARAWLCWRAMSIGNPEMSETIAQAAQAERQLLSGELDVDGLALGPDSASMRAASCLLQGLVDALAAPVDAFGVSAASQVWRDHRLQLLRRETAA